MRAIIVVFIWLNIWLSSSFAASINAGNFAIGFSRFSSQPVNGIKWSTLGVVADSNGTTGNGQDNTTALNSLLTNVNIIGDCPAGGGIRIASRWFLQSNLTIYIQPNCIVYCDWPGNVGAGCLTSPDVTIALTNIFIDGLHFKLINPLFKGKAFRGWVDHFTISNFISDNFYSMAFARGSDQEWSFQIINSKGGAGTVATGVPTAGLRHFGNIPKVTTTGGKPANVWVHNSIATEVGDGIYQVAPACQDNTDWSDTSADDYLFENNYGSNGTAGTVILIGNGASLSASLTCVNTITNLIFQNITGASSNGAIKIQNAFSQGPGQGVIDGIIVKNINIDMSSQNSGPAQSPIFIRGYDNSPINNVNISNSSFSNIFGLCADISAAPTINIVLDNISCPDPRTSGLANILVRATTGLVIRNSLIGNRTGSAIQLGTLNTTNGLLNRVNGGIFTVASPSIQNNTLFDITNNDACVLMLNVNGASVNGNNCSRKIGQTKAIGINLTTSVDANQVGAINSTITNNILSLVDIPIICAPVTQNNIVNSNTGALSCP